MIRSIQEDTGARVQFNDDDGSDVRVCIVTGSLPAVERARTIIDSIVMEAEVSFKYTCQENKFYLCCPESLSQHFVNLALSTLLEPPCTLFCGCRACFGCHSISSLDFANATRNIFP